jgi:hypothetical protein
MKFTQILVVLIIICSLFTLSFERRIRKNKLHSHKLHSHSGLKPGESKYYQLVLGVLLGAANTTDDKAIASIDMCLPVGWQVEFDATKLAKALAASTVASVKAADEAVKKAVEGTKGALKDTTDAAATMVEQMKLFTTASALYGTTSDLFAKVEGKPTKQEEDDAKNAKDDKDGIKTEIENKADKSTFDKVLDIIEGVLNFVCKFKDNIKKLFTKKKEEETKKRRNRHRLFVTKSSKYLMSTANFWEDVTGFFKKIGDYVKEAWSKVVDVAKWVWDKIKENVDKAIAWVKGIIASPFVQKIITIVNCVTSNMNTINQLISTIKGITAKIIVLATGIPGIIAVFIDLLCNLNKFREAFTYLDTAKAEKDPLIGWKNYGFFIGKLFYAIGA